MSRLWPHALYAEDQPYHHSILTLHVLTRALQGGSLLGASIGTSIFTLRHFNILTPRPRNSPSPSLITSTFTSTLLRSSSTGALTGLAVLCVALPLRMRGREEIEWRDRSWRLLENEGQMECDDWTYTGMLAGGVAGATQRRALGWRGVVGGVGLGSVVGMVGYMGWRYGVKGGKRAETTV